MVISATDTPAATAASAAVAVNHVDFHYGKKQVLFDVSLDIPRHEITAFIGPSGCGKTTLLRCINRIHDRTPGARITAGHIAILGKNIADQDVDLIELRRHVGMVFQKYNPFPKSVYENVAFGLRVHGLSKRGDLDAAVESALRQAALWDDLKDRLHHSALALSGGQMQRLCIARAIATRPEVLLMDEPCSALDPISTAKIEELMLQLVKDYTVVIVTHNMQQARRVADRTAFFYMGRLIEHGPTMDIFFNPREDRTNAYVRGQFS